MRRAYLRDRSKESVREALAAVAPEYSDADVRLREWVGSPDETWWSSSAVVGDVAVLKFAWSAQAAQRLQLEGAALRSLTKLAPDLRIPVLLAASSEPALVLTRWENGGPLEDKLLAAMPDSVVGLIAEQLAEFLALLHQPALLS